MCGYSGFVYTTKSTFASNPILQTKFIESAKCIAHRGNEHFRHVFLPNLLLAHARLAFLDLSTSGAQPMWSANREWILIFNGEIYNYQSIRAKIISEFNYPFQSHSDSEVILAGFLCYQENILNLLEGEYSFTIFKADGSEFFAARDAFGVKPLFVWCEDLETAQFAIAQKSYQFRSTAFCFSSEIKGIFCPKTWDQEGFLRQATGLYEPIRTAFQHLIQVPQGGYLWAKKDHGQNNFLAQMILNTQAIRKQPFQNYQNSQKIYEDFDKILEASVFERTISDVELGVYLSGGIDSKTIAAYLTNRVQSASHDSNTSSRNLIAGTKKLKSFTVGFDVEDGFDEAQDAINFAHAAGYEPHVCRVNYDDLTYAYPISIYHSELIQPFTNGTAKWWLSRFASQHVKGVLTGDGADELLCGYPSFRYAAWWKFIFHNRKGNNVFDKVNTHALGTNWRDDVYKIKFQEHAKNPWLSGSSHEGSGVDFIESLHVWGVPHPLFGQIKTIAEILLGVEHASQWLLAQRESVASWFKLGFSENDNFYEDPQNALMLWQNYFCHTHLPVHVLNWVGDRMEMANTLEGRPPFLSKKLKQFIFNLGDNFFVRGFEEKSILKRNFKKQFPQYLKYLPKQKKQFNAPLLFGLNPKFHTERIIAKIEHYDLVDNDIVKKLLNTKELKDSSKNYSSTYVQSTLQTLVSFTYVDDYIRLGQKLERNFDYEEKKINELQLGRS